MTPRKNGKDSAEKQSLSLELKRTNDIPEAVKAAGVCTFRAARYFYVLKVISLPNSLLEIPSERKIHVHSSKWSLVTVKENKESFTAILHLPLEHRNMGSRHAP